MCTKGGSPPVPNATSTAYQSATAPSAFMMPYYQNFISNASNLAQTPFNPAMMGSVAPMNAGQTAAIGQIENLGMTAGQFDPNAVTSMQSPYTQDVVQATQDWFNNQNAIQGTDLLSQAIRTGNAFGGDRPGIAEAQLAGQQQMAQAPVIAGLRQAGYTQALNEYNLMKQMGLAGAQQALGAGTAQQQQAQRELDVAQQNAMMQSAYPFQLQNWYGSTLGGIGPLMGTSALGYTTPPPPSLASQITGGLTALAGLGTSLFGKRGGSVELQRGGLVDLPAGIPLIRRSDGVYVPSRRSIGGLVPTKLYGGGLIASKARAGTLGRRLPMQRQQGGSTDITIDGGGDSLGQLALPQYNAPPDAGVWIQQQMRRSKQQQQQQQPTSALSDVANLAKAAAPLFMMLERGGAVKRYQDGGDGDDGAAAPAPAPVATDDVGDGYVQAGYAPAYGARVIPGLGPPPRNFLQRWTSSPLFAMGAGMLASRSPYFGVGLGQGMFAASQAAEQQRKEDLLENRPQMMDTGDTIKYRVGNKIIDTGLQSPRARAMSERMQIEQMREQAAMERQRVRSGLMGGRPSPSQEAQTQRYHMGQIQQDIRGALKADPTLDPYQVGHDKIDQYNQRWGTNFPVPAVPEKAPAATPAQQRSTFWDWWNANMPSWMPGTTPQPAAPTERAAPRPAPQQPAPQPAPQAQPPQQAAQPPDLGDAIKSGKITEQQAIDQARAAAKANPANLAVITDRLRKAGVKNFGDLLAGTPTTTAPPVIPQSQ
ncbi:MAG: hypothetical protein C5B60_03500 [Chloroflexi bacterium]|nr:MAG: hypothetical protein C5B60_03500 [Chloroflexota bacterium]